MTFQFFPLYPGDYMRKTQALTILEHGAYMILLMNYYSKGKLPSDKKKLYRVCRAIEAEEQVVIDKIVSEYFTTNGDGLLINKRAEEELEKQRIISETNKIRSAKGHKARWGYDA